MSDLKALSCFDSAIESYLDAIEETVWKNLFYLGFSICNFIFGSKYWSNYIDSRAIYGSCSMK
jgi:hypothetical protein